MRNTRTVGVFVALLLGFVFWYIIASDYGDGVVSGTYRLAHNGDVSTLVLKPDHSFEQELNQRGKIQRATGTWRRVGEGGIAFSNEFLVVSGQEPAADGTSYADIHKALGFLVSLQLRQYDVLWYGRVDPSPINSVWGTYTRDENGISATLILRPDHRFEQSIKTLGVTKQAKGSWSVVQNGDILFSKDFLKTSGEALSSDETASAWDPKGSNFQIQIARISGSGQPTFRKRQFF